MIWILLLAFFALVCGLIALVGFAYTHGIAVSLRHQKSYSSEEQALRIIAQLKEKIRRERGEEEPEDEIFPPIGEEPLLHETESKIESVSEEREALEPEEESFTEETLSNRIPLDFTPEVSHLKQPQSEPEPTPPKEESQKPPKEKGSSGVAFDRF